ncbi:YeeE/YedE family protein [Marinilongibacter aquaticus]|uniref:YeeE/YedE family protein n=1 Tax=Marinilongibacter aquaticus TaxID=2975157 RepID=UPI0021BDCC26|nr:YeeE/YedE family protein [Marinilongibacter aquaticus]UBM58543.1 YeeE/YedE family protein [Marinilongibacter aquaticus]
MFELLREPWPWYVAGPLIGLTVPLLLILDNKSFGISSSLRHICASCFPSNIDFFKYNWKAEAWNLFFVAGIAIGAFLSAHFLENPEPLQINPDLASELKTYGLDQFDNLLPAKLIGIQALGHFKGFIFMILGGFLVGFGARYAGGCTSGHAIMGLSNLQWPSLVATVCFMLGGFLMANVLMPIILSF